MADRLRKLIEEREKAMTSRPLEHATAIHHAEMERYKITDEQEDAAKLLERREREARKKAEKEEKQKRVAQAKAKKEKEGGRRRKTKKSKKARRSTKRN